MRLLLFLLLIPLLAYSQKKQSENHKDIRWRIGLALQNDNGYWNPYARASTLIIPKAARPLAIHFVADFLPFQSIPFLWLNAEISRYQISGGNRDFRWLDINQWPEAYFIEETRMNYWHGGVGFSIEPFAKRRISPYIGGQLLIVAPTEVNYRFRGFDDMTTRIVTDIQFNSGEQWALGWEVNVGFRVQLTSRINTAFGFYHVYTDFRADWPSLEQRSFPDGIMRLNQGGLEIKCQFSI